MISDYQYRLRVTIVILPSAAPSLGNARGTGRRTSSARRSSAVVCNARGTRRERRALSLQVWPLARRLCAGSGGRQLRARADLQLPEDALHLVGDRGWRGAANLGDVLIGSAA